MLELLGRKTRGIILDRAGGLQHRFPQVRHEDRQFFVALGEDAVHVCRARARDPDDLLVSMGEAPSLRLKWLLHGRGKVGKPWLPA